MLQTLAALTIMQTITGQQNEWDGIPVSEVERTTKRYKVIPKGCKEYYFNSQGQWDTSDYRQHHITIEETVFITVASSPKKAIEKFNKFNTK